MLRIAIIVAIFGLVLVLARPQPQPQPQQQSRQLRDNEVATILKDNREHNEDGSFNWDFETSDGTKVEQRGYLKNVGTDDEGISIQGQYSYIEPEGGNILLRYVADENGFVPEGAHLPTSPPIPEPIQRALEIIYKNANDQLAKGRQ